MPWNPPQLPLQPDLKRYLLAFLQLVLFVDLLILSLWSVWLVFRIARFLAVLLSNFLFSLV